MFPALLHLLVIWDDRHRFVTKLSIAKNIFIMVIGTIGAIVGTYEAVNAIINDRNISPAKHRPDGLTFAMMANRTTLDYV